MAQVIAKIRHHQCPRCGSRLVREVRTGANGLLLSLFFLRRLRCTTKCGWRGLRFSRSLFRARRRRLGATLMVVLFIMTAGVTVRYLIARFGSNTGSPPDQGIEDGE